MGYGFVNFTEPEYAAAPISWAVGFLILFPLIGQPTNLQLDMLCVLVLLLLLVVVVLLVFSWFGLCKKNSRGVALSTIQKLWPANHGMLGAVLLRNERSNDLWKAVVVVVRDITSSISWLMKNRQVRLLQLILGTFWQSRGKISSYQGFSRCGEVEPWKNRWRAQAVSEKKKKHPFEHIIWQW